ncbi:MAG: 4Fe-4S dicluster domain-containing protein [Anaerolineales bacterium]|nr:4Fe-4S dicluster domain-containing protein [Anaerolineales bacterium]
MAMPLPTPGEQIIIPKPDLQTVFDALGEAGYTLVGPTLGEGAIIYDEISSINDLPIGWTDRQEAGSYRLERRADSNYFGYVLGPHSWKKYLFPPSHRLFSTESSDGSFRILPNDEPPPRYAFIGARACELAAIAIQDRVFIEGELQDPHYQKRRENAFILAVNCTEPGQTCFCVSMKTGPAVSSGFDLCLTEEKDVFLVEVGSPLGAHMLAKVNGRPASALEFNRARQMMVEASERMGRHVETQGLPELLFDNLDHRHWDDLANRCLSCANCTMVCPTCFCSDVKDTSNLSGTRTERIRVWDSCFNPEFSYVFGGNLRPGICNRYRQWLTHKMASWVEQFGTFGCVGCGRCITWCPVGIDLTEEIAAIRGEGS